MSHRRPASPFANRILIGAITTQVLIVAVFLACNANSGLPFVPTYACRSSPPTTSTPTSPTPPGCWSATGC